jgi:hypothetical protein
VELCRRQKVGSKNQGVRELQVPRYLEGSSVSVFEADKFNNYLAQPNTVNMRFKSSLISSILIVWVCALPTPSAEEYESPTCKLQAYILRKWQPDRHRKVRAVRRARSQKGSYPVVVVGALNSTVFKSKTWRCSCVDVGI